MSVMLEKAIVDAKALKEAAMKNAEQAIVEKYSPKIKEAVDNILEQDEFDDLDDEEFGELPGMEDEIGSDDFETSGAVENIPLAGLEGEKLCACPEEEDEIEIDFDELERQMMNPEEKEEMGAIDREGFADDLIDDEDEFELEEGCGEKKKEKEELKEYDKDYMKKRIKLAKKEKEEKEGIKEEEEICEDCKDIDEEFEIDENFIKELAEELRVDIDIQPSGYQGANSMEEKHANEAALAKMQDSKIKEELEDLKKEMKKLEETRKKDLENKKKVLEENKKLKNILFKFKDKLNEIHLTNVKLSYKNRVLSSNSLNERQKNVLAEAIDKSNSIESVKTVFETLKSAVGNNFSGETRKNKMSKSLNEVIQKNSTVFHSRNREKEAVKKDPNLLRMQKLAGIKK